jgi:hypothetical protein
MKTKYCDMCGEREPDYSYKDTICGTTEEIENFVCSFCAEELFQANYGKDEIIYFKRIDGKNLSPACSDLFTNI